MLRNNKLPESYFLEIGNSLSKVENIEYLTLDLSNNIFYSN